MEFRPDWTAVQERYHAWWNRRNDERPLVILSTPRDNATELREAVAARAAAQLGDRSVAAVQQFSQSADERRRNFTPADWRSWWWDADRVIWEAEASFSSRRFFGEALPILNPNLGPDYFAACYGIELHFGADTSWAEPGLTAADIEAGWKAVLNSANPYRLKMLELTQRSAEAGAGRWLTGVTDLHAGLDALVSLRGAEECCFDIIDFPDEIERLPLELFAGFQEIYGELAAITDRYQKGTTNWMGIWHPEHWYVTSCDALALISPQNAERFVWPELDRQLAWLDASIFHLDGPDAIRHIDCLLAHDDLAGIQWVYGAGQPSARHWIGLLQRIQAAGKNIHIEATFDDLEPLITQLEPEGLMIVTHAANELEGERIMEYIEDLSAQRRAGIHPVV